MSSSESNPFLTSTKPCMCGSGNATKDCCGPKMNPIRGDANTMRDIGPVTPNNASYSTYLGHTIRHHLKKMFPQQANLDVATQNFQDKEFRSLAIVKKVEGKWERDLFIGTWGHTSAEAAKESLLFIMMQAVAKAQGDPAPSKQAFDNGLQTAWQATQALMKATDASIQGST